MSLDSRGEAVSRACGGVATSPAPRVQDSPGTDSPRTDSPSTDSPCTDSRGAESPSSQCAQSPVHSRSSPDKSPPPSPAVTNFCIAEILKPDFGRPVVSRGPDSAFVPWASRRPADLLYTPGLGPWLHDSCRTAANRDSHKDPGSPSPLRGQDRTPSPEPAGRGDRCAVSGAQDPAPTDQAPDLSESDRQLLWPAWVYCTRYSDRPSSGPRTRKVSRGSSHKTEDKRPRTAFTSEQLQKLKTEFELNRYLTEERRHKLATQLELNESQIKIWFQNKRAKIKKSSNARNGLALHLMEQGLYNHSTVPTVD